MAALLGIRPESLSAIDIAAGEPDIPYDNNRKGHTQIVSNNDVVVIVDHDDRKGFEYPVRVYIDPDITAEEAAIHEEVERVLLSRKVAAVCLQRWWREQSARRQFRCRLRQHQLSHWIWLWRRQLMVQEHSRTARAIARSAINDAQRRSDSAIRIASAWRGLRLQRHCRSIAVEGRRMLLERLSANLILSHFHRYTVRTGACLRIQTCWRNHQIATSLRSRFARLRSAAVTSQAALSTLAVVHEFGVKVRWVRFVQNRFRRKRSVKRFRNIAVLYFQSHVNDRERAAVCLQSVWRRRCCRHAFTLLRSKAIVIQRSWRCYLARQEYHRRRKQEITAHICAAFQTISVRSEFVRLRSASELLQSSFLSVIVFDRHVEIAQSVLILQHIFRRNRVRRKFRNLVLQCHQKYRLDRNRSALCLQAVWRGRNCRRLLHGSFQKLRSQIISAQTQLRSYIACKEFQRLKKHSELDSRRQVLITQLESLPDSRDQRLQSLRERFSRRLASIEGVPSENSQETVPGKASVLSALDAKRARLFRVKTQLDLIKGRKTPARIAKDAGSVATPNADDDAKIVKSVRWRDDHGSFLADSTNPMCRPHNSAVPTRSCLKVSKVGHPQRKCAQRIINVLSTTFGKARACRATATTENSSRSANLSATMPAVASKAVAKSPLNSSARRVRIPTKFS